MFSKDNIIVNYIKQSYQELEKVTWLTRKQMVQSSILVIVISIILTAFLSLLDYLFSKGYIYIIDHFAN